MQPVLIDGEWRPSDSRGSFGAVNPSTGEPFAEEYPVSSPADLETAIEAGHRAVRALRGLESDRIAVFLDAYADGLMNHAEELATTAHAETGLPYEPRLHSTELPRTADQMRQGARVVRDRSWCNATIDTELDIRSRFAALGAPVTVIGPNNFPFAFNGISGGDFVAAVAAGNPVIAKAHPSHPATSRRLA